MAEDGRAGCGREAAGAGRFPAGATLARAADRPEPAFLAFALAFACGLLLARAFAFLALGLGTYATCTWICFGLASSRFGRVSFSTPSLNSALIFSVSTTFGSVNERLKVP